MPELAEVETVRNVLKKSVLNKKIKDIEIFYPKMIENDIDDFKNRLIGNSFHDIKRIGKYLIFELEGCFLISHLRMEGKYFYKEKNDIKGKHEHVKFTFFDDSSLRYEDVRKFGKMHFVKDIKEDKGIIKQGIEANSSKLNKDYLYDAIHLKNVSIKTLLLDQTIISGLGNIYADEVLYFAHVNPLKKGCELTKMECNLICLGAKEIIDKAILYGGTTIKSYTSSLNVKGRYQDFLQVHKKEGKQCGKCNSIIKKTKVGGRSTYYCDICQK